MSLKNAISDYSDGDLNKKNSIIKLNMKKNIKTTAKNFSRIQTHVNEGETSKRSHSFSLSSQIGKFFMLSALPQYIRLQYIIFPEYL